MQLSLRLSFYLRCSLGGYTVGTTVGFWVEIVVALAPQISPLNHAEVPAIAYEHLSHLPSRGRSFYRPLNGRLGGYWWGKIPRYHRALITAQNSRYDRFPLAANGWGTIHPVSDKRPHHSRLKGRGHPPKTLIPGVIHIIDFTPPHWMGRIEPQLQPACPSLTPTREGPGMEALIT
jgi:hypothetical protein